VQSVLKATYRSEFCENTNFVRRAIPNLGSLAPQASVLPLDHCDLAVVQTMYRPTTCLCLCLVQDLTSRCYLVCS